MSEEVKQFRYRATVLRHTYVACLVLLRTERLKLCVRFKQRTGCPRFTDLELFVHRREDTVTHYHAFIFLRMTSSCQKVEARDSQVSACT
jgi:hypothetical protein